MRKLIVIIIGLKSLIIGFLSVWGEEVKGSAGVAWMTYIFDLCDFVGSLVPWDWLGELCEDLLFLFIAVYFVPLLTGAIYGVFGIIVAMLSEKSVAKYWDLGFCMGFGFGISIFGSAIIWCSFFGGWPWPMWGVGLLFFGGGMIALKDKIMSPEVH